MKSLIGLLIVSLNVFGQINQLSPDIAIKNIPAAVNNNVNWLNSNKAQTFQCPTGQVAIQALSSQAVCIQLNTSYFLSSSLQGIGSKLPTFTGASNSGMAKFDANGTIIDSGPSYSQPQGYNLISVVSGHAIPNLAQGLKQEVSLTADITVNPPANTPGPTTWSLTVAQDNVGGHKLSFDSTAYVNATSLSPLFVTTANTRSTITFILRADGKSEWDGTFKTGY